MREEKLKQPEETAATASKGIKYDTDKPRMDLLSSIWIEGVSSVLSFGARKYASHNWRKGIERSRLLGAALRHIFAYLRGEDCDPETGLLHLHHASCCLMFASELHITRPDLDDRYKETPKSVVPTWSGNPGEAAQVLNGLCQQGMASATGNAQKKEAP